MSSEDYTVPEIRGLVVAVGEWYARTLAVSLPRNMRHLSECVVVTAPGDGAVLDVVRSVPGAVAFETDAFTRHGAMFNKGLAIEEAFDVLGRHGWLAVVDADILWPDELPLHLLQSGCLHGMRRRILEDPAAWTPYLDWRTCPPHRDGGPIGWTQVWHADDPAVRDKRPWYDVSFGHAGGGDAAHMAHWPRSHWRILPCEALHLGPTDTHWFGVTPEAKNLMAKFVTENGWHRAAAKFTPDQVARAGEVPGRVEVPGYEPSTFELPFVRRAQESRS